MKKDELRFQILKKIRHCEKQHYYFVKWGKKLYTSEESVDDLVRKVMNAK